MTNLMHENPIILNPSFLIPAQAQRMSGQVCIVTGAASGIGRAIATLLARHGAIVVVALFSATTTSAAGFPERPVRLIIGTSPGGGWRRGRLRQSCPGQQQHG